MFSREFGRPKRAKSKDIFEMWVQSGCRLWLCLPAFIVSTGPEVGRACRLQDLPELALVLWSCVPSFCPLSCFVFGGLLANMPLFGVLRAILAGFVCLVWVCVALVLCVACGAFVCVSG